MRSVGRRLRAEQGSLLIEVMIGAVLVALTSVAVLDGFDGAFKTAGTNKSRSVGASLAEQDQERLRSFRGADLNNFQETRTVRVSGVDYTVESETEWVRDANGIVSCTTDSTQAEYMKLVSRVRAPILGNKPVIHESLYAPPLGEFGPNLGTAAVQLLNRLGEPVAGIDVTISKTGFTFTERTNAEGCAVFGYIDAGSYSVSAPVNGQVFWDGDNTFPDPISVVAGSSQLFSMEYDTAARIDATFDTTIGTTPAAWSQVSIANNRIPDSPAMIVFGSAGGTRVTSHAINSVFPFTGGYDVFAGNCDENNPARYDADYFQTHTESHASTDPGGDYDVTVRIPNLHVTVTGSNAPNALVYAQPKQPEMSADCGSAYMFLGQADATGMFDGVLPFGHWNLCAQRSSGGRRAYALGHVHTSRDGSTATIALPSSGSNSC